MYGPTRRGERPFDQRRPLCDLVPIPAGAILFVQEDQVAVGRATGFAPGFMQQHQGQEAQCLRLRQQLHQQSSQADCFRGQVVTSERITR